MMGDMGVSCDTWDSISSTVLVIVGIANVIPLRNLIQYMCAPSYDCYGVTVTDKNLAILILHRWVLFGVLGCFWIYASLKPALHGIGLLTSAISVISILWIALAVGHYNDQFSYALGFDLVLLICILIGTVAFYNQCLENYVEYSTCHL